MSSQVLLQDQAFTAYVKKISSFPLVSESEEKELVNRWVTNQDREAAHKLVTSHLRLVVKIAFQFRNYGISLMELVAEGTVGLMKAIKNFDPAVGCKVATYAMWWIKSAIQEYIVRSWSLVRIGTTTAQRKLFFNLRKLQRKLFTNSQIAEQLSVSESELEEMDQTLSGNSCSLDNENEDHISSEMLSQEGTQEDHYAQQEYLNNRKSLLAKGLESLDERHKEILIARKLQQQPTTLSKLGKAYSISTERVRQIEARAVKKLKEFIANEKNDCFNL